MNHAGKIDRRCFCVIKRRIGAIREKGISRAESRPWRFLVEQRGRRFAEQPDLNLALLRRAMTSSRYYKHNIIFAVTLCCYNKKSFKITFESILLAFGSKDETLQYLKIKLNFGFKNDPLSTMGI